MKIPRRPIEREVPTVYQYEIRTDWFREFRWWERLFILFGCNLAVVIRVPTQHNPGKFQPVVAGEVTKQTKASDYLKEQMSNLLVPKKPKQ